jgi:hypothetical protein
MHNNEMHNNDNNNNHESNNVRMNSFSDDDIKSLTWYEDAANTTSV